MATINQIKKQLETAKTRLQKNNDRVIDARIIWAAEYSEFVSPHTRYIVTERRNK